MKRDIIAKKLKEYRQKAGLTQQEVAAQIGRPQSTIAGWESARSQPDADTLYSLLVLYDVSPNMFFGYDITSMDVSSDERELLYMFRELDDFGKHMVRSVAKEASRYNWAQGSPSSTTSEGGFNCIFLPLSEQSASAGTGIYLGPEAFRSIKVLANDHTRRAAFCVRMSGDSMEPIYGAGDIVMVSREPVHLGDIALVTLDGNGYIKRLGDKCLLSENKQYDPVPCGDGVIINGRVIGVLCPEWIVEM